MPATKPELVTRFFDCLGRYDIDAALELTTADVVIDNRNSNAPWRGIAAGHEQVRASFHAFRAQWSDLGGVRWDHVRTRPAGGGRLAIESRISGRGPATGLPLDARGGWLVSFAHGRVREGVLYQSFDEALLAGRRRAIGEARLYFVCEGRPDGGDPGPLLDAALAGGVEVIQLRDKQLDDEQLVAAASRFRVAADRRDALFFVNDRPDLVAACDADGVHVGQDDAPVAEARSVAGSAALVGLSTHSPEQFDSAIAARGEARADQLSTGPVWETPTKRGRAAAGLELIRHAAQRGGEAAWFAIGGIDASNVGEVVSSGARRIVVVRAIRDAADPEAAARELRAALD